MGPLVDEVLDVKIRQVEAEQNRDKRSDEPASRREIVHLDHVDQEDDDDAEDDRQAQLRKQEEGNRVARAESGPYQLRAGVFHRLARHQAEIAKRPARHVQRLGTGASLGSDQRLAQRCAALDDRLDTALGRRFLEQSSPDDDDADADEHGGSEGYELLDPEAEGYELAEVHISKFTILIMMTMPTNIMKMPTPTITMPRGSVNSSIA